MQINRQTISNAFSSQPIGKTSLRQIERMLKQSNGVALGSLIAMLICTYLLRNTPHVPGMLLWVGVNMVLVAIRWYLIYLPIDRKYKAGDDITRRDHTNYHLVRFALVCIWAVGGYLFLPTLDDPKVFVGFVIIFAGVITAAAQNNTSATTELPLIYVYPVVSGLVIRMLEFGYYFFATLMILHALYVSYLVVSISKLEKRAHKAELENEALLDDLTRQKEKADLANTQKSNFLAAASHDLRQPLNSLGLFLYSHRVQIKDLESIDLAALDGADSAFNALQELFDALTEISRLDEGSIGVSIQSVDLKNVVYPVIKELTVVSEEKGLRLDYASLGLCVASDPNMLTRILRNLIGNAIKYTEHGSVVVSEVRDGDYLNLTVSDTGIGIAKSEQQTIFDEYHQIANKKRQRSDGIGLGLSIVKKIAKLLDHPISVESTLGEGSSFTLKMPLCPESQHEPASKNLEITSMTGLKVLVVDDEVEALRGMQSVLQSWGCIVNTAETPQQARECIRLSRPQIILSDYRLHERMNGIELISSLKQEFMLDIPCLIISGDKSKELVQNAELHGFHCLAKPVNIALLNNMLNQLTSTEA